MSFSNFFWLLSAPSWIGVFLSPSLGISVSYNLSRNAALETLRGTDPEFPREWSELGFLRSHWISPPCKVGSRRPGTWIWDLGSGTWDPGPGIWDLEAGTQNPEMNSNWNPELRGGREAVFPALGRDPFAEQLRWNLMSTKRRSIHLAISLILDSTTT
ncbi:hypothetical protein DY000_02022349 [Brassica cretica]|uniref:Uncharacterized protein n=1 Tax=Brassica cretica TaxID=69181 RepID=A0ABQ7EBX3_BRACR|nr:hypothetical protein DY000_02022349 [Brassica cretica]